MNRQQRARVAPHRARALRGESALWIEVFDHLYASVAEEMGAALLRAALSPNIRERRDFSCALFDARGRMVAQAAHLPVHLGSAPLSVQAAIRALPLEPGDVAVLNDPYEGGTHLPDLTLVAPIHLAGQPGGRRPDFYCANRAHHADVGGAAPGSMAPALDVHGEGLRLPPVALVRGGRLQRDVLRLMLANMRVPAEREADLLAQWAACRRAEQRMQELAREHGTRALAQRADELLRWTEALTARRLRELPRGRWRVEDVLEIAPGRLARIRLELALASGRMTADFRASDDQQASPLNTVHAVAVSAVFYALRLLLPAGTPTNDGILRRARVLTRPGSLVDALYPAPVAAGNVETSQRLVDVLLAALARACPGELPAASSGTMSNLSFGGRDARGRAFTYYETLAGGAGASAERAGEHAVHTHMTNTRNTPVEVLETSFPLRVLALGVRRGSGGRGRRPGGDGLEKRLRFLSPVRLAWMAERSLAGPRGLAGGQAGAVGGAWVRASRGAPERALPSKAALELAAGAEIRVRTPGGGGFGRAPSARRARKPVDSA